MSVRAKLTVTSIEGATVKFAPDYSASKEDQTFAEATPSAEASFYVSNTAALEQFSVGKKYFFDITPAED